MVRIERHPEPCFFGVAEIVLDRPEKRNALTPTMLDALADAVDVLAGDPSAKTLLLRGEGSVFCAGFDLSLCKQDSSALAAMLRGLSRAVRRLRRAEKPVIVAAHGGAVAGGCALLAGADLVIGDARAKYGYPVVRLGISPAVNAPLLRLAVGPRAARERSLDPELISGVDARRIGLIDRLVDIPEDVLPRAQIEAARLAAMPPLAFAATKRWLNEIEGSDRDDDMDRALAASLALVGTEEERHRLTALP
jgi:enoyl-CoA hydratase/carnithine racemase